jgi:hypothetical protein
MSNIGHRTSVFRKEKNSIGYVFERNQIQPNEPDSMIAISNRGMKTFYDKEKQEKITQDHNLKSKSVSDKNLTSIQNRNKKNIQNMASVRENANRKRNKTEAPHHIFRMGSGGSFKDNNTVITLDETVTLDNTSPKVEESIPIENQSSFRKSQRVKNRDKSGTLSVLEMSLSEIDSKFPDNVSPYDLMSPNDTFHQHFDEDGYENKNGLISKIDEEDGEIEHFINIDTFENSLKSTGKDGKEFFPQINTDSKNNLNSKQELNPKDVTFQMENKIQNDKKISLKDSYDKKPKRRSNDGTLSNDTNKIIEEAENEGIILLGEESKQDFMKNVNDAITDQIKFSTLNSGLTGDISNKKNRTDEKIAKKNLDKPRRVTKTNSELNPKPQTIKKAFNSEQNGIKNNLGSLTNKNESKNTFNNVFQNDIINYSNVSGSREIPLGDTISRGMGSNVKEYALLSDISKFGPSNKVESDKTKNKQKEASLLLRSKESEEVTKNKKKTDQSIVNSEYISFEEKKEESNLRNRLTSLDGYFNDLGGEVTDADINEKKVIRKEIKMIKNLVDIKKLKENLFKKKGTQNTNKAPLVFNIENKKNEEIRKADNKSNRSENNKSSKVSKEKTENTFKIAKKNKTEMEELKKIKEEGENMEIKKQKLEDRLAELRQKGQTKKINMEIQELLLKLSQLEKNKQKSKVQFSDLEHEIARISDIYSDNYFIMADRASRNTKVPRIKRQSTTKNKEVMADFYNMKVTKRISSKRSDSKDETKVIPKRSSRPKDIEVRNTIYSDQVSKNDQPIDIYSTNEKSVTPKNKFLKYKTEPIKEESEKPKKKYTTRVNKKQERRTSSLWGAPRKRPDRIKNPKQRLEPFMKLSKKTSGSKNSVKQSMISLNNSITSKKRDSIIKKSREVLGRNDNYFDMQSVGKSRETTGQIQKSKTLTSLDMSAKDQNVPTDNQDDSKYNLLSPQSSNINLLRNTRKDDLPDLLELSEDNEGYFNDEIDYNGEMNLPEGSNAMTGAMMSDADYFNMSGPSGISKAISSRRKKGDESAFKFSQNTGFQDVRDKKETVLKNSYFDLSNFDNI